MWCLFYTSTQSERLLIAFAGELVTRLLRLLRSSGRPLRDDLKSISMLNPILRWVDGAMQKMGMHGRRCRSSKMGSIAGTVGLVLRPHRTKRLVLATQAGSQDQQPRNGKLSFCDRSLRDQTSLKSPQKCTRSLVFSEWTLRYGCWTHTSCFQVDRQFSVAQ